MINLDAFPDSMTLGEARQYVAEGLREGTECPCCCQGARKYRWTLYSTAARALIQLYKIGGTTEPVHNSQLEATGHKGKGDVSRLSCWRLVTPVDNPTNDDRRNWWQVTELGGQFVRGEVTVPKQLWIYHRDVYEVIPEPQVTIHDVLETPFDLDELLN